MATAFLVLMGGAVAVAYLVAVIVGPPLGRLLPWEGDKRNHNEE